MAGSAFLKRVYDYLMGNNDSTNFDNGYETDPDGAQNFGGYDNYGDDSEEETEESNSGNLMGGLFPRKYQKSSNGSQQIKMKIAKPTNFDQVDEIIVELKAKNAVVINLEYVNKDVARRIVDVVSGAIKALDGHIEKVSNSIFVIAPFNYRIVNEMTKEKIENKFSSSWIR